MTTQRGRKGHLDGGLLSVLIVKGYTTVCICQDSPNCTPKKYELAVCELDRIRPLYLWLQKKK